MCNINGIFICDCSSNGDTKELLMIEQRDILTATVLTLLSPRLPTNYAKTKGQQNVESFEVIEDLCSRRRLANILLCDSYTHQKPGCSLYADDSKQCAYEISLAHS